MNIKYDQKVMQTPRGKCIYDKWRQAKDDGLLCDEWKEFPDFYKWAVRHGVGTETRLARKDKSKCFSTDNCKVIQKNDMGFSAVDWKDKWNKTVNRIRLAYGLEPLK